MAIAPAAAGGDGDDAKGPLRLELTAVQQTQLSVAWRSTQEGLVAAGRTYVAHLDGVRVGTTEASTFDFVSLRCATSYTLGVAVLGDDEHERKPSTLTASTAPCEGAEAPPPAPEALALESATETSVTVSWFMPAGSAGLGYRVTVDGVRASETAATTATVAALACGSDYVVGVSSYDAAGRESAETSVVAATLACAPSADPGGSDGSGGSGSGAGAAPGPAGSGSSGGGDGSAEQPLVSTATFRAAADARVSEAAPTKSYGSSKELRVDGGSDPDVVSYLAFDVSGLAGQVTKATLRVYASSATSDGPAVYAASGSWAESSVTWQTRPSPSGSASDDLGRVGEKTWAEWDVTPLVTANARHSFALVGSSTDGLDMDSRETSAVPVLVVETRGSGPSPDEPAPDPDPDPPPLDPDPPPPPPPPDPSCTKTLAPGGSLSSFANGLGPGEVGCLRGGTYTDGTSVSWSADGRPDARITLTSYPGERAALVGMKIQLSGDYLTLGEVTIRDVTAVDTDGVAVSGAGARVEHTRIERVARHGILLHTDARDAVLSRNYIADVGLNSSNDLPDHGIYVQGAGHRLYRNTIVRPQGYGIHVYGTSGGQPSDIVIASNTVVGSVRKAGILVRAESGGNIWVVNNIAASNATYGLYLHSCATGGCVYDHNLVFGNGSAGISGSGATNTITADPRFADGEFRIAEGSAAIDAGRGDVTSWPDMDGVSRALGRAADVGAYEVG